MKPESKNKLARKVTVVEDHILNAVVEWNMTLASNGNNFQFVVECHRRMKKFPINSKDFYTHEIAELLIIKETTTETGNIEDPIKVVHSVIFRIEQDIPNGEIEDKGDKVRWVNRLYSALVYEMFGNFGNVILNVIARGEMSEYDMATDRPLGDPIWKGRKVVVTKANELDWFKEGDEYDVFRHSDNGFIVYTWSPEGKKNKGFAIISGVNCRPTDPVKLILH